jgi:hypothetical protein
MLCPVELRARTSNARSQITCLSLLEEERGTAVAGRDDCDSRAGLSCWGHREPLCSRPNRQRGTLKVRISALALFPLQTANQGLEKTA